MGLGGGRLSPRRLKESDCCEAGEHREPEKRSRLPLGKVRCAIDEVAETPVPNFLRRAFDIIGRRVDAAGSERHIVLKSMSGLPDIASKTFDEIGA